VVFQARSIDLDMTVQANLRFHGRLFGLSGAALMDRITTLATQFGLAELLARPVRTLSGGQQRRVEIARAMINRPDLLIMDEPSAGLDATSRGEFVSLIRELAGQENVAVLWATHLVDEVVDADRLIILDKGHIRADDSPAALLTATGAADLGGVYRALTGAAPSDTDP
jgi:ABC-2 type transport system ATP-binding protein